MTRNNVRRRVYLGAVLLAVGALALGFWTPSAPVQAQEGKPAAYPGNPMGYKVDPNWPEFLAPIKDERGIVRFPTTDQVGGGCLDKDENYVTLNRGYLPGYVLPNQEGRMAIPSAPIIIFNKAGKVIKQWGDASLDATGHTKAIPQRLHGCFVDSDNNLWMGGTNDGIVQKYSLDGKLLMQIGEKGKCDGAPGTVKDDEYDTCGSPGLNQSKTLLNQPADVWVDAGPDPVTGQRGSVYVADGYGNFRVVVFDAAGKYLRQWGSRGTGPSQFGNPTGSGGAGHPHCVEGDKDGLLWVCDRPNNRIQIFDKVGTLKRIIDVQPPEHNGIRISNQAASMMAFSHDKEQRYVYVADLDSNRIWVIENKTGKVIGGIGQPGHQPGQFIYPHSITIDSKGTLYVSETINGKRSQRFEKLP